VFDLRHLSLLLAFTLLPFGVFAQDTNCDAAQTQMDLTRCSADAWLVADDDLNEAFGAAIGIMAQIDAGLPSTERGAEKALRRAQRAWIAMRDDTCLAEGYQVHGGSAQPMMVNLCLTRLTQSRAEDLWAMADTY
jgi:uncharacterized protein YecT (DUF1311 family)